MSTRRARIKAVAALPPRRKNVESADGKNKPKDSVDKNLKSPRTPRSNVGKNEEKISPLKSTIRSPPPLLPLSPASKTLATDKVPSPLTLGASQETNNPPRSEKVPVITSTPSRNVFISPQVRSSPDRRKTASPLVLLSPKTQNNIDSVQRATSPQISNFAHGSRCKTPNSNLTNVEVVRTPNREENNDIPDDYSVPSVPESITDEGVMDGIVPLKNANNPPSKQIEMLKNQIISDSTEVSFDPIVPLPSPSKVRPKLRPAPRLAPHRRNSIQGSASESEDETRRALLGSTAATTVPPRQRHDSNTSHNTLHLYPNREMNRIRNDSVSSSVSQIAAQPPPATSPVKEKHFSNKSRRQEMSRRSWCRRREVKRDALTMYDLIFYNPTTNPIVPDEDEMSAKEANAKEEAKRVAKTQEKAQESEEDLDDAPATDAAPVPQIKLGPNGEIMLDEQSLVIKQSDGNRKVSSVVREGSWAGSGGGRYSRGPRTAEWSAAETVRFYRALAAVGTDFTLMAPLFPDRNRRDLYLKFKKEERLNGGQVDMALRSAITWDPSRLQEEFKKEREDAAKKAEAERKRLLQKKEEARERLKASKELRVRTSRASKAVESLRVRGADNPELTADDFIRRALEARNKEMPPREAFEEPEYILPVPKPTPLVTPQPTPFATLTLVREPQQTAQSNKQSDSGMATISKVDPQTAQKPIVTLNEVSGVPTNIETGSLVVLRVNDPKSPSKTMLQTYIAHGAGRLTPVALPPTFLNSVVGYMKKGTPKSTASNASSSPQITSPSSIAGQDSRSCTPGVIQLNPSPAKRQRHSSYTITPL